MRVYDLLIILAECDPEAVVKVEGQGFLTEAGTWLEDDDVDIGYIYPAEGRADAKTIVIQR